MLNSLSLLKSPRFLPIFIAQFGGALNDNLFRNAMMILVAFQLTSSASQASTINNLAALLFLLPFFLFSPIAGQLADRSDKAAMIQKNKIAEITITLIATAALFSQSIPFMMFVLFLLGAQSAMFGPNKYAVLPQLLSGKNLITANAMVASGTFIAILLGTLLGGILAQLNSAWIWIGSSCLFIALIGYIAAKKIPAIEIGDPSLKLNWNLLQQSKLLLGIARHNQRVWASVIGVSWFWFTGIAYLTQIPTIVRYIGGADESVVTLFLLLFILGIGLGCLLSARISAYKAETGFAPIAMLIMGLIGLNLAFIQTLPFQENIIIENAAALDGLANLGQFLNSPAGLNTSLDILLIGFFAGAYALPLYTELQQSTRLENRARIISINNLLNALFMVISSLIALIALGVIKLSLPNYLGLIAVLNIIFAFYLHAKLSARTWRFMAQMATWVRYRIKVNQIDKLPREGAAILVCNHVSYADPIIIFGACKRPIRFIMDKKIRETPIIKIALKQARTLGICSPLEDRKTYEHAINEAVQSLKNGELVFIFPEGRLSKDGDIGHFHRGVEKLIEGHPCPVYPMAIRGLWGSFFSNKHGFAFASGKALWGIQYWPPRRSVELFVGDAIAPETATAKLLFDKVSQLRGPTK